MMRAMAASDRARDAAIHVSYLQFQNEVIAAGSVDLQYLDSRDEYAFDTNGCLNDEVCGVDLSDAQSLAHFLVWH
jgi:hypothetical protein